MERWTRKDILDTRYDARFWAMHIIGCSLIFMWGMRTASRAAVSIAIYQMVRRMFAKEG